jgi:O-acetyl-ADP-ribose deacetylase (regulator of RNase III)
MKLTIRDRNVLLIAAIMKEIEREGVENVTCEVADIFKEPADAVVSPANSFGYMDGGIDKVYCERMGWHLHDDAQKIIKDTTPWNELLVGQALAMQTKVEEPFKWLIIAPTMRMPGTAIHTSNVFLSARAATFVALSREFKTVVMPGLGTGVGRVPPDQAAQAMIYGYMTALKKYKALNNK